MHPKALRVPFLGVRVFCDLKHVGFEGLRLRYYNRPSTGVASELDSSSVSSTKDSYGLHAQKLHVALTFHRDALWGP